MSSLCWYNEDFGAQYVASTRTCTHQHACCAHVLPWQPVAAAIYWSDAPASHVSKCACAAIGGAPHVDTAANELGRSLGVNYSQRSKQKRCSDRHRQETPTAHQSISLTSQPFVAEPGGSSGTEPSISQLSRSS